MRRILFTVCIIAALNTATASWGEPQPIEIRLASKKMSYAAKEPIPFQIRVFNENICKDGERRPLIVRRGFKSRDFHLMLTLIDPKGAKVSVNQKESTLEPPPLLSHEGQTLVPVETIEPHENLIYFMEDLRKYYDISQFGWYSAVLKTSVETFSKAEKMISGTPFADLEDKGRRVLSPLMSNKLRFEIAYPEGLVERSLLVRVVLLRSMADKRLFSANASFENSEVRLYADPEVPARYKPVTWQSYDAIWKNVPAGRSALTNARGEVSFSGVRRGSYLILTRHAVLTAGVVLGTAVEQSDPDWISKAALERKLSAVVNR